MITENPLLLQPGFDPDAISLRPTRRRPYSLGLRKPRADSPREIRWSLSNEIVPAIICALILSQVAEHGRSKRGSRREKRVKRRMGVHLASPLLPSAAIQVAIEKHLDVYRLH